MDKNKALPKKEQKVNFTVKELENKLIEILKNEFDDKLSSIIILSQNEFLNSVMKKVKITMENTFKGNILENNKVAIALVKKSENEMIENHKAINNLITSSINQNKLSKTEVYITEFKKHCNMTEDYAIHHCEGKMIPIYEKDVVKYILCENCKKLYTPNSMLLYCYFCSCEYFSSILSYKKTENLLPATWENFHCGSILNDKMRCIKCKDIFYLNISINMLYCKSCKYVIDPLGIIWQCVYCNQEYKSAAKVYNQIEFKIIKNFIKETLKIKLKAKPLAVPCCKIRVYDFNFFHKKSCNGEIFLGELNNNLIVLCEKCKMIYFYDKFIWTCPNCFKRFRKSINVKQTPHTNRSKEKKLKLVYETKSLEIDKNQKTDDNLVIFKRHSSDQELKILKPTNKINNDAETIKKTMFNNLNCKNTSNNNNINNESLKFSINNINVIQFDEDSKEDDEFFNSYVNKDEARKREEKIKENDEILKNLITFSLDNFKIIQTIGKGSYGVIYLVQENISNIKYAMKKLIVNNELQLNMFTQEYKIVYEIKHSNVLKINGLSHKKLDETTNVLYILMELAKTDWDKEIKLRASNKHPYSEEDLLCIIKQLIEALCYLQENNIAHRDIKPHNVLIFENKIYKLADFGEAKEVKLLAQKHMGTLRGTELYMAPVLFNSIEQVDNIEHNPYKSDVYSLGYCILLASTLSFNILYEIRKITNKKLIHEVINKFLANTYSAKFINLLCRMVEYNEQFRFDFIQLKAFFEKNIG